MYFLRLSALSHALAHDRVSQQTSFLHCFFTLLYIGAGLVGSSLFPALYLWSIQKINLFTQLYVDHGKPIAFFNEYNMYVNVAVYLLIVFGFWYCFYVNQHSGNHHFLNRFWTLSWPVLIRATIYTFLLALLALGSFIAFYLVKLLFIAIMSIKTTPAWILKLYNNVERGGMTTSLAQLRLIKELATNMNLMSWFLYIAMCTCAIMHVLFFIRLMAKNLHLINQVEKENN